MKGNTMKVTNLLISTALAFTAMAASAKEIRIGKSTKQIIPTKYIHVFDRIDWDKLEKRQDAGKGDNFDSHVMMCDDSYSSVVEIEFNGVVGKDVRVESDNCPLQGAASNDWSDETTLQFEGPDGNKSWECTIIVEKQQNGKKIQMNYNLHDAC